MVGYTQGLWDSREKLSHWTNSGMPGMRSAHIKNELYFLVSAAVKYKMRSVKRGPPKHQNPRNKSDRSTSLHLVSPLDLTLLRTEWLRSSLSCWKLANTRTNIYIYHDFLSAMLPPSKSPCSNTSSGELPVNPFGKVLSCQPYYHHLHECSYARCEHPSGWGLRTVNIPSQMERLATVFEPSPEFSDASLSHL